MTIPTLEKLERAADSLGMPRQRKDGVLLVKIRPWSTWLRIRGTSVDVHNALTPQWFRETLLTVSAIAILTVVILDKVRMGHVSGGMSLLAIAGLLLLGEVIYAPLQANRQRKRLFDRAAQLT